MKRFCRLPASSLIAPVVISIAFLQGPFGLASPAFGSCPEARFAPQTVVPAGGAVEGIAVADFNRDGDLDLAVTNFASGGPNLLGVAILLGNGRGGFGAPAHFQVGHGATRIVASDFSGDGKTDVAVLNANDGTVSILLGDGRGGLGPQAAFPTGGAGDGMELGDFNGDGHGDLVVSDFLAAQITVLFGSGDGSFSAPTSIPVGGQPLLLTVGDVNRDGKLDIAVDNVLDAALVILPGNGDGTFGAQVIVPLPLGSLAQSLALTDLNGDGIADLLVAEASNDSILVLSGRRDGSFDVPVAFGVGGLPIFFAVADLNNDGRADVAAGNVNDGTVSVLLGRGDGTFALQTVFAAGSEPIPVATGDFNHDGALDIVAGNLGDQTVSILLNECAVNRPPQARAGGDQILECTGDFQATARLDGSGSSDPDSSPGTNDDIASFAWSAQGRLLTNGPTASIPLQLGRQEVSLTVTDNAGATDTDSATVSVSDTTSPAIDSIVANPSSLAPRPHKLVPVTITAVASDRCDAAPACRIVSVTRNGSHPSLGVGATSPDWVISDPGPKTSPARLSALLRSDPGRVYTLGVSCRDAAGNTSSGHTTVSVASPIHHL